MKRIILSFCTPLIAVIVYGQAHGGTVEFKRNKQPAAVIEFAYAPDVVTAAMNDHLSKKGKSKANDMKGFTTYRNTQQVAIDSVNADLYFKMERKSRKEKEVTVVSLLLTMPMAGGTAAKNVSHLDMEQAKAYLNGLVPAIEAYGLEAQIKELNDAVAKAESKYSGLVKVGQDLEKRRENIDKNIRENKNQQQSQMNEVENQKQKLADMVRRRKL
jgi:hypothetical protein